PLVPAARLPAVRTVRFAGAAKVIARRVVASADQLDLRERIEHCAGRLLELNRAAHLERGVERVFGAREVAHPDTDLSERGEGDSQAVARSMGLVQRDAAFGERERLLVPMLH